MLAEGRWLRREWLTFVLGLIRNNIVRLFFAVLFALKLDGMGISWWIVFIPVWVDHAAYMVYNLSQCSSIKSEAELEDMTDEQRAMEPTPSGIVCGFIAQSILLVCVALLCNKLVTPASYSAYIVFLPVFITAGCLCCCLSCAVCTVSPESGNGDDEETKSGGAVYEDYGSTGEP